MKDLRYFLKTRIDPDNGFLESTVDMEFISEEEITSLSLFVHENLEIKSVESRFLRKYRVREKEAGEMIFAREACRIDFDFKRKIKKGEKVNLRIEYSGRPGIISSCEINRITEEFVELGIFSPWFPALSYYQTFTFEYEIEMPPQYKLKSNCDLEFKDGIWHGVKNTKARNIFIFASKSVETHSEGQVQLTYVPGLNEEIGERSFEYSKWLFDFYSKKYGDTSDSVEIVLVPRKNGCGYSANGMVILGTILEDESDEQVIQDYFRHISHGIAHIWWHLADSRSYEDWLNESFAEYSMLMAVREYFGKMAYNRLLKEKRELSRNLPPVIGTGKNNPEYFSVAYEKGCFLLSKLENEMGSELFDGFLKVLFENKISNTENFLRELEEFAGGSLREKFQKKLAI